jgi:outer membrane protein assembly factor BamE
MTRQQVRNILGSALLTSVFHADRWDYVFTLRRQGQADQPRRVTVFFKGEALDRVDADDLPSEAEFVATLSPRKQAPAVPVLEATEEQLSKYPAPAPKAAPALPPPLPDSYPPLEPVSR